MTRHLVLEDDMKEYWGFYLLRGSSVTVSACVRYGLTIDNFNYNWFYSTMTNMSPLSNHSSGCFFRFVDFVHNLPAYCTRGQIRKNSLSARKFIY